MLRRKVQGAEIELPSDSMHSDRFCLSKFVLNFHKPGSNATRDLREL